MTFARAGIVLIPLVGALAGRLPAQRPASSEAFQLGDRVLLHVEGDSVLSDTFTVAGGPVLPLPGIGDIPLAGVSRAEVEAYLTRELGRFLRNPVVRARALVRIGILGEVVRPGFYAVPADLVLADAVMVAGGGTTEARLDALRVERGGALLLTPDALRRALAAGGTIDHLGLRAGDHIVVPRRRDPGSTARILGILLAVPAAIWGLTQLF
ncbi:MAG: polysaccharide biosynthesis/export family protein [Gemmatimonadales bacterium]